MGFFKRSMEKRNFFIFRQFEKNESFLQTYPVRRVLVSSILKNSSFIRHHMFEGSKNFFIYEITNTFLLRLFTIN